MTIQEAIEARHSVRAYKVGTGDRSVSRLRIFFKTFEIIFLTIPAGQ